MLHCSSLCSADRRIFLVGKTSHNFVEIIKSALNVDVNCYVYDTNNTLFVCKTSCYKRLLKFQRASGKVEEIKKEIQHAFQARPRAKRLPRPSDGNVDEINDEQRSVCKMGLTGLHDSYWFVAFVHLPFSLRSLDLFVASLLFMKGASYCVVRRK